MKKSFLLFAATTTLFAACSSESEVVEPSVTNVTEVSATLSEIPETKACDLFGVYANATRAVGVSNNLQQYDFEKSQVSYLINKDAYVYMVPMKGDDSRDNLLVGIGTEDEIMVQLYLEKTEDDNFILYNQDREPIYDITYDKNTNLSIVTNVYGNDAMVIAEATRAWSKHTWSVICNTDIIAGGVSLALVGAIPTMGASIGCTVVCGVASAAMC